MIEKHSAASPSSPAADDFGPPEPVLIEREWLDGPRAGLAEIGGRAHRFVSQWSPPLDDALAPFLVWPASDEEIALEREQWEIFVRWTERYEAGGCDADSHPALPGRCERWAGLDQALAPWRSVIPGAARVAHARLHRLSQRRERYHLSGPNYMLAWRLVPPERVAGEESAEVASKR